MQRILQTFIIARKIVYWKDRIYYRDVAEQCHLLTGQHIETL